jgi:hypothetical protein
MFFVTYIIKRDIGLDVRQISPLTFIDLLQRIEIPSKSSITLHRKKPIPTTLKKKKYITN